jgi:hypothetical protein
VSRSDRDAVIEQCLTKAGLRHEVKPSVADDDPVASVLFGAVQAFVGVGEQGVESGV